MQKQELNRKCKYNKKNPVKGLLTEPLAKQMTQIGIIRDPSTQILSYDS